MDGIIENEEFFSDSFRDELRIIQQEIEKIDFSETTLEMKFENPLRRIFESNIAINMLTNPTKNMMDAVHEISKIIIYNLQQYEKEPHYETYIEEFLKYLKNGYGEPYIAAIGLGSFAEKKTLEDVINLLQKNDAESLPEIMHVHFIFAHQLSRKLPIMNTQIREPIGKFKEIVENYRDGNYHTYFQNMASHEKDNRDYNSYLPNTVLYSSPLFTTEKNRGRKEGTDYSSIRTKTLGLMCYHQSEYEKAFPVMDLPWTPDAKVQLPDYNSKTVKDLLKALACSSLKL